MQAAGLIRSILGWLLRMLTLTVMASLLLWWQYDGLLPNLIPWSIPSRSALHLLYLKMSLLTGFIATLCMLLSDLFPNFNVKQRAFTDAGINLVALWLFTMGTVATGLNESGGLIAHFFGEYDFLTFALLVSPPMAAACGGLSYATDRLRRKDAKALIGQRKG